MNRNCIIKIIAFASIFVILLGAVSQLVATAASDQRNYQRIQGFYAERENSLDAVYVGGSNVYSYWEAPLAWGNYGIAVYPFANSSQPMAAAEYMIREARKTQPDALYIVSINNISLSFSDSQIHYTTDYLNHSLNKYRLINTLSDLGGYNWSQRLEFFFPLLRYHSRWSELREKDFKHSPDGLKGGSTVSSFLRDVTDVSASFGETARRTALDAVVRDPLEALLDYCDAEHVNALFVTVPQARTDEARLGMYNTIRDLVEARGYPVLNMQGAVEEIGINLTTDFYNENHTNIHGAAKITDYFAQYLLEHYSFRDKRGDPAYADWDQSYDKYLMEIAPYALDFEYTGADRNPSLPAPELLECYDDGEALTLTWNAAEGASGYCVYRKTEDSGWVSVATADVGTLTYQDEDCEADEKYIYTVASYQEKDGVRYWGGYDFNGLSGTVPLDVPD